MFLISPTFVLPRRINQPLGVVEGILCDPHVFRAGVQLDLATAATRLTLESPFGVTFPPFGVDGASWCAPAAVRTRWRQSVRIELEINEWDPSATELLVRPRSRRPWRWGGGRLREYFRTAHLTADQLTRVLGTPSRPAAFEQRATLAAVTT